MINKLRDKLSMKTAAAAGTIVTLTAISSPAWAVGTADTTVTTAMTTIGDNITATLGAVAPLAVGILGCFLAWKYGKKIFNTVSK